MEGDGGDDERGEKGGPTVKRKRKISYFLSFTGGEGGLQSVRLGTGGWFRPLPLGTRQARKKGKWGPKGGIFMGGRKEKKGE